MIQLDTYSFVTILSSVAYGVMGIEIMLKEIPKDDAFKKLRMARRFFASAYVLITLFSAVECIILGKYHYEYAGLFSISSAAYQCVLLAATLTTCFNPAYSTIKRIAVWLGITAAWTIPSGIAAVMGYEQVIYYASAAYLLQLGGLIYFFNRNFKKSMSLVAATDQKRLVDFKWVTFGIHSEFTLCIVILIFAWLPSSMLHNIFTFFCVAFYIWFSGRFSTFAGRHFADSLPVLTEAGLTDMGPETGENYEMRREHCRKAVDSWVARKGFCEPDPDRDTAAGKMGLEKNDLQWYFAVCLKEDFRSWRIRLRIEEAKAILTSNPDAPINELAKAIGFSSRSNFFTYFKKYTGEQTSEFIARIHNR